jgi:hypothetical protein
LRGYLPEYGLGDLESEHLTDFLESRPMSGRTWNNYRRDFHVAFAWAVDQKYLLTNPAASVPEAQEDPIDAQVLSLEEFLRLIKAASFSIGQPNIAWPRPSTGPQVFTGLDLSTGRQLHI